MGKSAPVTLVKAGTPKVMIEAWNSHNIVGILLALQWHLCGALIGNEAQATTQDFKACGPWKVGDEPCFTVAHWDWGTKRVLQLPGGWTAFIMVPGKTQIFSTPMLVE